MSSASPLGRFAKRAKSAYWLRFLDNRWLVYRDERLIAAFPEENVDTALAFFRHKQSEESSDESGPGGR